MLLLDNSNLMNAVSIMKAILLCLLFFGLCNAAWADVQIKFKNVKGSTSTISSNGHKVRINGAQMSGYVLVDSASGEFFMVDPERKEIINRDSRTTSTYSTSTETSSSGVGR
jgi:exosome complex RNA-binding protein Rrp42 (RNase PH superfamily)